MDHTDGTASAVVEAVVNKGFGEDGFKALADLSQRFDSKTAASRLAAFLDVVNPKPITRVQDVISGVHGWESKVGTLKTSYGEDVGDQMKLAIFIAMLPKEMGDMVMSNSSMVKEMTFGNARDHVLNTVEQLRCNTAGL